MDEGMMVAFSSIDSFSSSSGLMTARRNYLDNLLSPVTLAGTHKKKSEKLSENYLNFCYNT